MNTQIWKTIEIGTGLQPNQVKTAIRKRGIWIDNWAEEILRVCPRPQNTVTKIDLVSVLVSELFNSYDNRTREEIYERAKQKGLSLCPAEVGYQLRLQYSGLEILNIGMEPLVFIQKYKHYKYPAKYKWEYTEIEVGCPSIFVLATEMGLRGEGWTDPLPSLSGYYGNKQIFPDSNKDELKHCHYGRWIFICPR